MGKEKFLLSLPFEEEVICSDDEKTHTLTPGYTDIYLKNELKINHADSGSRIPFKIIKVIKIREIDDIHVLENSMILEEHAGKTLSQYTAFDRIGDVVYEAEHIQTIVSRIMYEADDDIDNTCILYFNGSYFWVEVATVVRAVDVGLNVIVKHRDSRASLTLWVPDDRRSLDEEEESVEPPKFFLHDNLLGEQAI